MIYGNKALMLYESKSNLSGSDKSKIKKVAKEIEKMLPRIVAKYNQGKAFQIKCKKLILDKYKQQVKSGIEPEDYFENYVNNSSKLPEIEIKPIGKVEFYKYSNCGYAIFKITNLGDDDIGYATIPAMKELSNRLQEDSEIIKLGEKYAVGIKFAPYSERMTGIPSAIEAQITILDKEIKNPKNKNSSQTTPPIDHSDQIPIIRKAVEKVLSKYNSSSMYSKIKQSIKDNYQAYGADEKDIHEISFVTSILDGKRKMHPFKIYDMDYNIWDWSYKNKIVRSKLTIYLSDEPEIVQCGLVPIIHNIVKDVAKEIENIGCPYEVISRDEYTDDAYTEIEILFYT